jgi:hypothetical protein
MATIQFLTADRSVWPSAKPSYTRGKIIVSPAMITNESGLDDPFKLFDQPALYNEGGSIAKPTTEGWIPSYKPESYPLSFYVDLGGTYNLDAFYIFDGNGFGSISISIGTPGNWTKVFADTLQNYEQWNQWMVNVTSRYFRVTYDQYNDVKGVREIVVYGTQVA